MKEIITLYLHSDKDANYEIGEELGLKEEALKEFSYVLYEVKCKVQVDMKTGKTKLLSAKET